LIVVGVVAGVSEWNDNGVGIKQVESMVATALAQRKRKRKKVEMSVLGEV